MITNHNLRYNNATGTEATDIIKLIDFNTGQDVNYREVKNWHDGFPMSKDKVDGVIFKKIDGKYYMKAEFLYNRDIRLSNYIPTDGKFHTISSIFPDVTLEEVQRFDSGATLSSSAAWYAITKLISWIPKFTNINPDCDIQIDRQIIINKSFFSMRSSGMWTNRLNIYNPYIGRQPTILQITTGQDVLRFIDGSGVNDENNRVSATKLKGFNIRHIDQTGDGIAFRYTSGTTEGGSADGGDYHFEDVHITHCKNGIKKYGGHINNLFFTRVVTSYNYNLGMDFPSSSEAQTNYIVMRECIADANGLENVNGKFVNYKQDLNNPNYEKGGIRISGTAISIYDVALQLNNGLGLHFENYIFGGFVTGYAEQNQIGDFGTLSDNPDAFRNCQVQLYSLEKRYYIPSDRVRRVIDPAYSLAHSYETALKSFGPNLVEDEHLLNSDGGNFSEGYVSRVINEYGIGEVTLTAAYSAFLPKLTGYNPRKGDIYLVDFEVKAKDFSRNNARFAMWHDGQEVYFNSRARATGDWQKFSATVEITQDPINNSFLFVKGAGDPFSVRRLSIRKLEAATEQNYKLPKQKPSEAKTIKQLREDFNAFMRKMEEAEKMSK